LRDRISEFVDSFTPGPGPVTHPPAGRSGYSAFLADARKRTGVEESAVIGRAELAGQPLVVIASDFSFVGGSMGAAAGERIVRAYDTAAAERLPVLIVARSGGARLHEGMAALIQLARTADAARRHCDAGLLSVAYAESPTTGGVYASHVALADLLWAGPGALLGFAGPRVVEVTTGAPLDPSSHTSESAWRAGIIDAVLEPAEVRAQLTCLLTLDATAPGLPPPLSAPPPPVRPTSPTDAWSEVQRARDPARRSGRAWLDELIPKRVDLSGDRVGGVDPVVTCGVGRITEGPAAAFVALNRDERSTRIGPAGYRTAQRAIALGARLGFPLLTLIDTPGADPSEPSERGGIAGEIARTLAAVTGYPNSSVSLVVGEGGSAGAMAFAATDRCFMLEGSVFEVIRPEAAAAILERDITRAPEVATRLALTTADQMELGIIDGVLADADVPAALRHALATAQSGEGRARLDSATERWLHPS